jgi:hypothetical protein
MACRKNIDSVRDGVPMSPHVADTNYLLKPGDIRTVNVALPWIQVPKHPRSISFRGGRQDPFQTVELPPNLLIVDKRS